MIGAEWPRVGLGLQLGYSTNALACMYDVGDLEEDITRSMYPNRPDFNNPINDSNLCLSLTPTFAPLQVLKRHFWPSPAVGQPGALRTYAVVVSFGIDNASASNIQISYINTPVYRVLHSKRVVALVKVPSQARR